MALTHVLPEKPQGVAACDQALSAFRSVVKRCAPANAERWQTGPRDLCAAHCLQTAAHRLLLLSSLTWNPKKGYSRVSILDRLWGVHVTSAGFPKAGLEKALLEVCRVHFAHF